MPSAYLKLDLAVAAGIPAKRPFDDATNKSVIKLLPRKPPAIEERPGDRRRKFGYIEIRTQLAARLRPREADALLRKRQPIEGRGP
jgi:hypothetical protein